MKLLLSALLLIAAPSIACPLPSSCLKTEIENRSKTWTKEDEDTVKEQTERCKKTYPGTPCLSKLIKFEDGTYQVTCGGKTSE